MEFVDRSLGLDAGKIDEHVNYCQLLEVKHEVEPLEAICAYTENIKLALLRLKTFNNIVRKSEEEALDGVFDLLRSAIVGSDDEEEADEDD